MGFNDVRLVKNGRENGILLYCSTLVIASPGERYTQTRTQMHRGFHKRPEREARVLLLYHAAVVLLPPLLLYRSLLSL